MSEKVKTPAPKSTPKPLVTPVPGKEQAAAAEPAQVLGRHKNTGQKDHKGAR